MPGLRGALKLQAQALGARDRVHAVKDVVVVEGDGEALALHVGVHDLGGLALLRGAGGELHQPAVGVDVKAHGGVGERNDGHALERGGKLGHVYVTAVAQEAGSSCL